MTAFIALSRWGGRAAWPLDALRLGIAMALLGWATSEAVRLVYSPGPTEAVVRMVQTWSPAAMVAFAVVVGPVLETAALALLHWLLRARAGLPTLAWAWASAILFALAHVGSNRVPLPQFLGFLFMSYQYAVVRDRHGAGVAYAAVVLSHATYNAVVVAVVAVLAFVPLSLPR